MAGPIFLVAKLNLGQLRLLDSGDYQLGQGDAPRVLCTSSESAEKEAEFLAGNNLGSQVYIFQAVSVIEAKRPQIIRKVVTPEGDIVPSK